MKNQIFLWGQRQIEKGAWFFAPLSWIWAFVSWCRNLLYDFHCLPITKLPCIVVSVGNIVAGGTGKTPFVHLLAKTYAARKVAILSRGYGAFADEAALLQRRLPEVVVYVGKDRIASGRKAIAEGAELLILDDGFQHRRLFRDVDIVLLDGDDPFGKGHYLPWGYLRDSPKRIKTADFVFVNGQDLKLRVKKIVSSGGKTINSIEGWKVALFSGIAKPRKFKKTVEELGAHVVDHRILADHASIDVAELKKFVDISQVFGAQALVCTEKDFVKLSPQIDFQLPILFLEMEIEIADSSSLWQNLIAKIDQKIDNHCSLWDKK